MDHAEAWTVCEDPPAQQRRPEYRHRQVLQKPPGRFEDCFDVSTVLKHYVRSLDPEELPQFRGRLSVLSGIDEPVVDSFLSQNSQKRRSLYVLRLGADENIDRWWRNMRQSVFGVDGSLNHHGVEIGTLGEVSKAKCPIIGGFRSG